MINNQLDDLSNKKPEISPVILALLDWLKGKQISDEAFYRIQQFGFVDHDEHGKCHITISGEQTLSELGLI